jgi:murein DD-endopeptidase MepM/ murein hydrolase activator NlpD
MTGRRLLLGFGVTWLWVLVLPGFYRFGLLDGGPAATPGRSVVARGTYTWPVPGWVTSDFGFRQAPEHLGSEFHTGIDIAANMGTPVRTAADGRVIMIGPTGRYGNLVIVEHVGPDWRFETWYAHLSVISVVVGAPVEQGSVVGHVGSTGRSTGPHLHFEYRVGGKPVDPYRLYR